jgi:predicted lipoprotein with Yx(FWY)xxD motif
MFWMAAAAGPAVSAHKLAGVGMVLDDRSGKTVYSPQQEAHGKILCTGSCPGFWLPVSVAAGTRPQAAAGVHGPIGTIRRTDDGLTQVTYNGRRLYPFRLDQRPGELHGNDVSDQFGGTSFTWQAVAASGVAASASQSVKPGGGYSYPANRSYGN